MPWSPGVPTSRARSGGPTMGIQPWPLLATSRSVASLFSPIQMGMGVLGRAGKGPHPWAANVDPVNSTSSPDHANGSATTHSSSA